MWTAGIQMKWVCDHRSESQFKQFPQFTSFHSVFHSFHGLMNSINWPASSVWVFIAQLGEHCSANAEATGSNPVEAPKIFFSGYFRNCLNCDSRRWSHTHFICIPAVHIISFRDYIMSVNITQLNTYLYKLKLLLDAVTNQRKHLPRPQLAQKFEFSDTTVPQLKQYISTGPPYGKSAPTRAELTET